jgi:hypothetical protein
METLIIIALLVYLGWSDYNNRKTIKNLINSLKAKDASELANLDLASQTKINIKPPKKSDLISLEDVDDNQFDKVIEGINNG